MKVSIVVLNWNRPDDTLECLESISKLNLGAIKVNVYVVDNASSDDSVEKIRGFKTSKFDLEVIVNKDNLGFAGGNNAGLRYALQEKSDYVMVLNNDTILDPNCLDNLLECIKSDENIKVVSPKIYFAKGFEYHKAMYKRQELGRVIWYAGGEVDWDNVYGINCGVDEVDSGQYDVPGQCDFATGTCSLFKTDILRKVGLYDERYFLYFEDTEISQRITKAGYSAHYCPKALVWHKVAQSSGIGSSLNDYFLSRNRLLFAFSYAKIRTRLALVKESIGFIFTGRKWQKRGIIDFFLGRYGKGSWNEDK